LARKFPAVVTNVRLRVLLFLCTGNDYRSRFAELWFNHHAAENGLDWFAVSRGLRITPDTNPGFLSGHVLRACKELALPVTLRDPRPLTAEDLERADHVVAMDWTEHFPMLRERFSGFEDRVEYWDIGDLPVLDPDEAIDRMRRQLEDLSRRMMAHHEPQLGTRRA
jgi:protein-tyrosine phosphatase